MKKAFTMIELIFVIVILGILAAVALPKFVGVASQAREGNLKSFVGTLNRTVGPTLWSQAISNAKNGDISQLQSIDLKQYTDIPDEIKDKKVYISKCNDKYNFKVIATIDKDKMGSENDYAIVCRTGTSAEAPKFELVKAKNKGDTFVLEESNTTDLYGSGPEINNKAVEVLTVSKSQ